jgi:cytochrome b6-f complex iron-sulfur subunit
MDWSREISVGHAKIFTSQKMNVTAKSRRQNPNDGKVPRRVIGKWFLGGGLAGLAAFFGWKLVRSGRDKNVPEPPNLTVVAAGANELHPNTSKTFTFGPHEALLIRLPGGDYRALTAVCTHMGCEVRYLPAMQQVWCPCHKGIFDVNGEVVSGPPPRPLRRYGVDISNGEILVSNGRQASS